MYPYSQKIPKLSISMIWSQMISFYYPVTMNTLFLRSWVNFFKMLMILSVGLLITSRLSLDSTSSFNKQPSTSRNISLLQEFKYELWVWLADSLWTCFSAILVISLPFFTVAKCAYFNRFCAFCKSIMVILNQS